MTYRKRSKKKNVVIIGRPVRQILNIKELAAEAEQLGFEKVSIIDFAELPVLDQLNTIIDTDILIGVQGAGLQWAIFMQPRSVLVEIARETVEVYVLVCSGL